MDSFLVAMNAVLPVFLLMALGYALKKLGVLQPDFLKKTNSLNFRLFLPVLLFSNVYRAEITELVSGKLLLLAVGTLLGLFLVLCIVVPLVVREPKRRGVIIQGLFRSNYVILGVTFVANVYGEEQAGVAAVLSAVLVPLYNVLAVIALTVFTSGGRPKLGPTLLAIAKNPLIIAAVIGVIVSASGLRLPSFAEDVIEDLGGLATPLALLVLGGDFSFTRARGNLKTGLTVMLLKLVVIPACFVPLAVLAGLRGPQLLALTLAWETPVAVSSYIMAQEAGADGELAGQLVVLSTACCIPTVFLMIFILRSLGLL